MHPVLPRAHRQVDFLKSGKLTLLLTLLLTLVPCAWSQPGLGLSGQNPQQGSASTGTISVAQAASNDVVVTLTSTNTGALTVPATVTLPQGQTSVSFGISGVNLGNATILVAAPGYYKGGRGFSCTPAAPAFSPATGTYAAGQTIALSTITANATLYYSIGGAAYATYSGPLTFTANETITAYTAVGTHTSPTSSATYSLPSIPTQVAFTSPLSNVAVGMPLNPVLTVSIEDVNGNVVPTSSAPVTVSLVNNPNSAVLSGPTTVNAVNGVATFTGLNISAVGPNYTLTAVSDSLTSDTTPPFNVTSGFTIAGTNGTVAAGSSVCGAAIPSVPDGAINNNSTLCGSVSLAAPSSAFTVITLASDTPSVLTVAPSTIVIAPGATTAPFLYSGNNPGSANLTAASAGYTTATSPVTVTTPPSAPTYYVSSLTGSDSYTAAQAQNQATPWQTLKNVGGLSAAYLTPGSSVLLQCGSVFTSPLFIAQSGAPNLPVNYSSYGNCSGTGSLPMPLIDGADILSGWTASSLGTYNVYSASEAITPSAVFEDSETPKAGVALVHDVRLPLTVSNAAPTSMAIGSAWYNTATHLVSVRTFEDSAPTAAHSIEASVRDNLINGNTVNYIEITGIEADKAVTNDVSFGFSGASAKRPLMTGITLTGLVTNYSGQNGINFYIPDNKNAPQTNILIQGGIAEFNGASGVSKNNDGSNVVVSNYVANYNAFRADGGNYAGILLVSNGNTLCSGASAPLASGDCDGPNDAYRPTFAGIELSTTNFNGVNPDNTSLSVTSGNSGMGVHCDTCGNGSFVTHNSGKGNTGAGAMLEWTSSSPNDPGSQSMTYNQESTANYGILHSNRSQNDYVANNTAWGNFINCDFSGEPASQDPLLIGMVNNTYANNICAGYASNSYGATLFIKNGTDNTGISSGNVFTNNSMGLASHVTQNQAKAGPGYDGNFVIYGATYTAKNCTLNAPIGGCELGSYALFDYWFGLTSGGASTNSVQGDPLFTNAAAGDFSLKPGSPAIGAGVLGVDLGAVPFNP